MVAFPIPSTGAPATDHPTQISLPQSLGGFHDTKAEAEESAKRLAQRTEEYAVEQFDGDCPRCHPVTT